MTALWLFLFGMLVGVGLVTLFCLLALAGAKPQRAVNEAERRALRRCLISRPEYANGAATQPCQRR